MGKVCVLPLADIAVPLLRSHRARQDAERGQFGLRYDENDLVFCNPDGTPWPPETFTKQFAQITRWIEGVASEAVNVLANSLIWRPTGANGA